MKKQTITLNDEVRPLPDGMTVHDLLHELDPQMPIAVVRIGRTHIPLRTWKDRLLQDGDDVRVVYIIAGG